MKLRLCLPAVALLALTASEGATAREGKKSPLLAGATWDLKAFNAVFRVERTEHDKGRNQVRWALATKEGVRTFDFVRAVDRDRPFTFVFQDEDGAELARTRLRASDFKGVPKDKIMKAGTRLEVTLELPKAMPRVKKVVLRRGAVD
jgi:hypothetical protein